MRLPRFPLRLRWLGTGVAVVAGVLTVAVLARVPLAGFGVGIALRLAGAGEIRYRVAAVSPWRLEVEDVEFRLKTQVMAAQRVTFQRAHWWSPSFGTVRIEGFRLPLTLDGSEANPYAWISYQGQGETVAIATVVRLPVDGLEGTGWLELQAAALPTRAVAVRFSGQRTGTADWKLVGQAQAPGLAVRGEGRYEPRHDRLDYRLTHMELDLRAWQEFILRRLLLPGGSWALEGRVSATVEGSFAGRRRSASGLVQWRGGGLRNEAYGVRVEGVEADLEFSDFLQGRSRPGSVRIRELRRDRLELTDLELTLGFAGYEKVELSCVTLQACGGRLVADPVVVFPEHQEVELRLRAQGLEAGKILAALPGVPVQARGRLDGELTLRLDPTGLRFGTGWLAMRSETPAEIRFHSRGLLTSGRSPGGSGYALLQRVETGQVRLQLREFRLDLRPADGPPGCTARLHLVGVPLAAETQLPLALDVDLRSPLESVFTAGEAP